MIFSQRRHLRGRSWGGQAGAGGLRWCVPGPGGRRLGPAWRGGGRFQPGLRSAPGSRCWVTPPPPSGHLVLPGVSSVPWRVLGAVQSHPPPAFEGFLLGKGLEGHQLDGERSQWGRTGSSCGCSEPPSAGECGGEMERGQDCDLGVPWPSFSPPDLFYPSPCGTTSNLALGGSGELLVPEPLVLVGSFGDEVMTGLWPRWWSVDSHCSG